MMDVDAICSPGMMPVTFMKSKPMKIVARSG